MRVLLTILLSLFLVLPATAATIRPMTASPSVDELRRACSAAGGTFIIHADGGGYGCAVENCDGKGGICHVVCDNNNNCTGSTPLVIQGRMTLLGILQNGDMVYREPKVRGGSGSSLSSPSSGGVAPPKATEPSAPTIY